MSRMPRAGGRYIAPLLTTGVVLTDQVGRGIYTLLASTTYLFILGGADAPFSSIQLTGYTAGLVITSATIQDTNHHDVEVPDTSVVVGEWMNEDPTTAFVSTDGTGWSATNGVAAASGAGVGGALWHFAENGSARIRLSVVVGGTGGNIRCSGHGKD